MAAKKNSLPKLSTRGNDINKTWFVFWYDAAGRRQRKYGSINSHNTIEKRMEAAEALIREIQGVRPPAPVLQRIAEYIAANRMQWRKKTFQTYSSKLEVFTAYAAGRELSGELITSFFQHLSETRKAATRNWYISFFRNMLKKVGAPDGLLKGIDRGRSHSSPAMYFQRYQIARLKKYLLENDAELWHYCEFLYYCFIRPGELRLMKVEDIYIDDWKIRVPADVSKNRVTQMVTIPVAFRAQLQRIRERGPGEYLFHPAKEPNKPYSVNQMSERHRKALRALGFSSEYKLYSWKHTGAIAAVQAGVTVKELQIQLRHSSLEMVDKYLRQLGAWDLKRLEDSFPAI
ncbi:MAG: site-specific integrase [Saprospiraceae bacterium]|nr:site-specific integrase [Saprospiraceae bacterium]